MEPQLDYIVIGAGSAGCVIANRLSVDPELRVLLIEAGPDFSPGAEPAALRDRGCRAIMLPQYFWPNLYDEVGERRNPIAQARLVGGGSSINGMHAQRGLPRDYDEWQQHGVQGWNWNDVLPFFMKLEKDVDFAGPQHGRDGPITIRRVPEGGWSKLSMAFRAALETGGLRRMRDINTELGDGVAPTPLNNSLDARVSTSVAYLTPEVRSRPNLMIMPDTQVVRVTFEGTRANGVELAGGRRLSAPNVVVCAGAIHSPVLLLRSGIGPATQLQAANVPIVADRAGVGRNLRNHPILTVTAHLKRAARQHLFRSVRPPVPMIVRYSSKSPGESSDMVLNLWERLPGPLGNDPLGRQLAQLMVILNKSHSRGTVQLNARDPQGAPRIQANILSDPRDLRRMVDSFRWVGQLLSSAPMRPLINHSFVSNMAMGMPPDAATLKMLQDNREAYMVSLSGALAMDFVPGMRAKTLRKSGRDLAALLAQTPEQLAEFVTQATGIGGHPSGTCRLGAADSEEAVVDSRCRVIGTEGLRVADASIFPTLMTAGTNLPTIMAAEKAADMILQERRLETHPRGVVVGLPQSQRATVP